MLSLASPSMSVRIALMLQLYDCIRQKPRTEQHTLETGK